MRKRLKTLREIISAAIRKKDAVTKQVAHLARKGGKRPYGPD